MELATLPFPPEASVRSSAFELFFTRTALAFPFLQRLGAQGTAGFVEGEKSSVKVGESYRALEVKVKLFSLIARIRIYVINGAY
jgi:hypothetical protein